MLVVDGPHFTLVEDGRSTGPFAFADLVGRGSVGGHAQFGLGIRPGWRIDVPEPVPAELAARLPRTARYGELIDRTGLWLGAAACAGVAALAIVALAQTPRLVARLLPPGVERSIGRAMVGDFGNRSCDAPAGRAALDTLIARLGGDARGADIRVINMPIVNAVTLPGGNVLVFDGLLQNAKSGDEVAGVIAHELGHVAHRDVMASLIRQLGLSVVLGGLGGDGDGWVGALLAAGYSREAEGAADGYAIAMLRDARIAPAGVADFFGRLAAMEPRNGRARTLIGYVSTHPLSDERRRRFVAGGGARRGDRPALDAADWAALRSICKDDPHVSGTELRL